MNAKVLVVDDSPDTIQLMMDWLDRFEYRVVTATRGEQALALAESEMPDAILLDVLMPDMDGVEVCRRLRANPNTSNIPVLLITARSPTEGRAEGLMAGAVDYITKPINMRDLVLRIEAALDQVAKGRVDNVRLLEEMVHVALTMLPCDLAWLLVLDSESGTLVSRAIAAERSHETAVRFLSAVSGGSNELSLSMVPGMSPLTQVLITRQPLLNQPVEELRSMAGGGLLYQACRGASIAFLHITPLFTGGKAVGTLVMGTAEKHEAFSTRGRQVINALSNQAATAIENTRLLTNLSRREEQMRTERAYRQMILDTMGDGLVVIGENGIIQFVNTRLLRVTGYTRKQLIGQNVGVIFHPEGRDRLVAGLLRREKATMSFEQRLLTQKGKVVPVLMSRSTAPSPTRERGHDTIIVLSDLTEQKEREEALERQTKRLRALNRAAQAITSSLSEDEVVKVILGAAADVVRADTVMLLRYNEEDQSLTVASAVGENSEALRGLHLPQDSGVAGWVVAERTAQLVSDVPQDERFSTIVDEKLGIRTQSLAAVPLIAQDRIIGVLEVLKAQGHHSDPFAYEDVELLESLAGVAAVAIVNAQLFEQTQRRVLELTSLLDASSAASSTLYIGSVLELIAGRLLKALRAERCIISSWLRETNELSSLAEVTDAAWPYERAPIYRLDESPLARTVLETGLPVVANIGGDTAPLYQAMMTRAGIQSMLAVPVLVGSQNEGMVGLYDTMPDREFTDADALLVDRTVHEWLASLEPGEVWHAPHNLEALRHRVMSASGARWCAIYQWDREAESVRALREQGFAIWLDKPGRILKLQDSNSFEARVLKTKRPIAYPVDASAEEELDRREFLRSLSGACLIAPLNARGESIGLVTLLDSDPTRMFDHDEVSLCQGIANLMGNALENAELYRSLERRALALEEAYQELQEADRLKDELIQNVSHELRTPLAFISGYLDLLVNEEFGPLSREQKESMEVVIKKTQDLSHLVDDLLSIQRLEGDHMNRKVVQLSHLAEAAIRAASVTAAQAGLELVRDFPDDLPLAYMDPQRINEVLDNLLSNAIKFSPSGGKIIVFIRDADSAHLVVGVQDQGIGISTEHQERIWSRFYQVDGSTTRRFGGTGLGLAIVKGIIEAHGGEVWVESEPGKGSTFYFTVPKDRSQEAPIYEY